MFRAAGPAASAYSTIPAPRLRVVGSPKMAGVDAAMRGRRHRRSSSRLALLAALHASQRLCCWLRTDARSLTLSAAALCTLLLSVLCPVSTSPNRAAQTTAARLSVGHSLVPVFDAAGVMTGGGPLLSGRLCSLARSCPAARCRASRHGWDWEGGWRRDEVGWNSACELPSQGLPRRALIGVHLA